MQMRIITICNTYRAEKAMHAVATTSTPNISSASMPGSIAGTRAPAQHVDLDSRRLFGGTQEVRIHHEGQEYRLRQTRNGKLILTK